MKAADNRYVFFSRYEPNIKKAISGSSVETQHMLFFNNLVSFLLKWTERTGINDQGASNAGEF